MRSYREEIIETARVKELLSRPQVAALPGAPRFEFFWDRPRPRWEHEAQTEAAELVDDPDVYTEDMLWAGSIRDPTHHVVAAKSGKRVEYVSAARDLPAGRIVCFYAGELRTEDEHLAIEEREGWSPYAVAFKNMKLLRRLGLAAARTRAGHAPELILDAREHRGYAGEINSAYVLPELFRSVQRPVFANGHGEANVELVEALDNVERKLYMFVVTCRPVAMGDELYLDYGAAFWERYRQAHGGG